MTGSPVKARAAVVPRAFLLLSVAVLVVATACAGLPPAGLREQSSAWDRPQETRIGRAVAPEAEHHPGMSGFHLLANGMDAFAARMALAETAERTLDLQYYIVHGDLTGKLILAAVLNAADRGVRVRLLVDDTAAKGKDAVIAAIASHPQIEVRIFNPAAGRSSTAWLFSAAADFDRINRRMHNKMFVADNEAGVVGGRNLGDEYFGARETVNFADMDLLAVGPVVQDLSKIFDGYWNSEWAVPIEDLHSGTPDAAVLAAGRNELAAHAERARDTEYAKRVRDTDLLKKLQNRELQLVWARAEAVSDSPEKASGAPGTAGMLRKLRSLAEASRSELIISSPYFIPGDEGIRFFGTLVRKGVRVRIVTNSFAGNDVALVHSGYARYRKGLLKAGVELHELKPSFAATGEDRKRFGSSEASLHAKTFIIDRERLFVGSFNLDPRSAELNTELGIVVESPELAAAAAGLFDVLVSPATSYRLSLDPADGDLVWTGEEEKGKEIRFRSDPEVGWWRRASTWFLSFFAPESLL